jgi:hypothetical protein
MSFSKGTRQQDYLSNEFVAGQCIWPSAEASLVGGAGTALSVAGRQPSLFGNWATKREFVADAIVQIADACMDIRRPIDHRGIIARNLNVLRLGLLNHNNGFALDGHRLHFLLLGGFKISRALFAFMRCTAPITSFCCARKALPRSVVHLMFSASCVTASGRGAMAWTLAS